MAGFYGPFGEWIEIPDPEDYVSQNPDGTYNSPTDPETGQTLPPPPNSSGWNPDGQWDPLPPLADPEPLPSPSPAPAPSPTPNPGPGGGGDPSGGGGGGDFGGGGFGGFSEAQGAFGQGWDDVLARIGPAPMYNAPELPTIDAFSYDPWEQPSFDSIYQDGSYLGRKREGEQALLNSKAAQGLARTGHSLKDLLTYNQDFAGREYGNIVDRSLQQYTTNRGNAFDNFRANTANTFTRAGMEQDRAWNMYQPQLSEWQTKAGAGQRGGEFASNQYRNMQNDLFDRLRWLSEFDLDAATR